MQELTESQLYNNYKMSIILLTQAA